MSHEHYLFDSIFEQAWQSPFLKPVPLPSPETMPQSIEDQAARTGEDQAVLLRKCGLNPNGFKIPRRIEMG
jgi:hypothetical protein